jgi:hypothetical protein
MIIYAPKKRTEPYVPNEQIKQIYEKYKDYIENIGATAEFPPKGLKSFVGTLHKVFNTR